MTLDQIHAMDPVAAFAAGALTGWFLDPKNRLQLTTILGWRRHFSESIRLEMTISAIHKLVEGTDLPAQLASVGASLDRVEWPMVAMGLDAAEQLIAQGKLK